MSNQTKRFGGTAVEELMEARRRVLEQLPCAACHKACVRHSLEELTECMNTLDELERFQSGRRPDTGGR